MSGTARIREKGWFVGIVFALTLQSAPAAVAPHEAARLESELTPLGGERAGNAEGTIPAWDGGYTTPWPGYQSGQPRPDPFANERPRLQITRANMAEHLDELADGVKALLERLPTYRLDVYPTHRTAAAPQWVYDNTLANATRARTTHGGQVVEGAFGGIPFPVPKSGAEAIWNHLLSWRSEANSYEYRTYLVASGRRVLSTAGYIDSQSSYYDPKSSIDRFDGTIAKIRVTTTAPPFRVGEDFVLHEPLDQVGEGRKSWQYLVGQRRVRRVPNFSYDHPSPITSGFTFFDESYLFNGAIDRYEWRIVGKREIYIPYNTQSFHTKPIAHALGPAHPNPDHVRWELHRVWVIEATLAPGKRHQLARRRFYLDEDTWIVMLVEGWDARGQLWHVGHALPFLAPELPGVFMLPHVVFDLIKGGYSASSLFNEGRRHFQAIPRKPEDYFSPAALAAGGLR